MQDFDRRFHEFINGLDPRAFDQAVQCLNRMSLPVRAAEIRSIRSVPAISGCFRGRPPFDTQIFHFGFSTASDHAVQFPSDSCRRRGNSGHSKTACRIMRTAPAQLCRTVLQSCEILLSGRSSSACPGHQDSEFLRICCCTASGAFAADSTMPASPLLNGPQAENAVFFPKLPDHASRSAQLL